MVTVTAGRWPTALLRLKPTPEAALDVFHKCLAAAGAPLQPVLPQLNGDAPPNDRRCPLQAAERDVVFRVKQAVHLGPARLEQCGHLVLRDFPRLHGFGKLPCDDLLDRLRLRFLEDALLLEGGKRARGKKQEARGTVTLTTI